MRITLAVVGAIAVLGYACAGDPAEPHDLADGLARLDAHVERAKGGVDPDLLMPFFMKHRTPPADPGLRPSWYAHTTRYLNAMVPREERPIGVGQLGLPFETFVTVEGVREERGKVGTRTLAVDRVDGKQLEEPVRIWVEHLRGPGLPPGTRCVLRGFETGSWIGGDPDQQAGWQFRHVFAVTEVVEPDDVKLEEEPRQAAEREE